MLRPEDFNAETRALLEAVGLAAKKTVADSRPENTRDGYAQDWETWEKFTAEKGLPVLAVEEGTLVAFVHWLWQQPGKKAGTNTAPSTVERRLSGVISTARKEHGLTLDRKVASLAREYIKALVKQMEKDGEVRGTGPAPALLPIHMKQISKALPDNLRGVRDRSLMTMHFAIAGREHELAYLRNRDITEDPEGRGLLVDIRVSKVKPRKVKVLPLQDTRICPVTSWRKYKADVEELTGEELDPDDFAFRRIHAKGKSLMVGGITPEAVGDVITRCGEIAGLDIRPTGHSPRRGLATAAKKAGNDRSVIAAQGGWAPNSTAMEGYFDEEDGWEENALRGVG
ncbi:tyrosine-type recombinase/integrase [Streptomyces subrutilus]|uniref:tyrosine-type recombinase/integrase n=1 Tax=Streptomyces subrutilus TaxID=36818 RepID=UPI0009A03D54|nr:tyrosine-type recombinase/integrase [Streptomyces subrutilus]